MKKTLLTLCIAIASYFSYAQNTQWSITDNIGIGKTNPGSLLDVKANTNGSNGGIRLTSQFTNNFAAFLTDNNTGGTSYNGFLALASDAASKEVVIQANGTSYFNGGNVGIGTPSPGAKLDIWPAGANAVLRGNAGGSFPVPAFELNGYNSNSSNGGFTISTNDGGTFSEKLRILSDGNVGIGTTSPGGRLTVGTGNPLFLNKGGSSTVPFLAVLNDPVIASAPYGWAFYDNGSNGNLDIYRRNGTTAGVQALTVQRSDGNVGIGTTSPKGIFQLGRPAPQNPGLKTYTGLADTDEGLLVDYYYDSSNSNLRSVDLLALGAANASAGGSQMRFFTTPRVGGSVSPLVRMVIDNNGNVGIGTSSPDTKLTVNGTIHSTEVKVESSVPTPDYVFEPDYKLMGLNEIKAYVNKNHHLPEIPSAKEIEKNGIQLGDMNMKLLKKVEELTLYLIEKEEQLQKQKKINIHNQNNSAEQNLRIQALEKSLLALISKSN